MSQIKTPSFDVKQGGCRQTPPTILWFGGSCSSLVVLTSSQLLRQICWKCSVWLAGKNSLVQVLY